MTVASPVEPPATHPDLTGTGGRMGEAAEDFVVDEELDRQPEGAGEHRLVRIRKVGLTTREAVVRVARATGQRDRDIGTAGMKDKNAITSQWLSLPAQSPSPETWQSIDGVEVLEHVLDRTKLRTGQLRGNRFRIRLVGVANGALQAAQPLAKRIETAGLLNVFGSQRFGLGGGNLERALGWVRGGCKRRLTRFELKFLPSVVQSEIFNRYALRRQAQDLTRLLAGEVVRLAGVRSMFVVEDADKEQERLQAQDIFLTGPMVGPKMRASAGQAQQLEQEVLRELELSADTLGQMSRRAPGTRRDLLVYPTDLQVSAEAENTLILRFFLPAGSYATEIVRAFTKEPFFVREAPAS